MLRGVGAYLISCLQLGIKLTEDLLELLPDDVGKHVQPPPGTEVSKRGPEPGQEARATHRVAEQSRYRSTLHNPCCSLCPMKPWGLFLSNNAVRGPHEPKTHMTLAVTTSAELFWGRGAGSP